MTHSDACFTKLSAYVEVTQESTARVRACQARVAGKAAAVRTRRKEPFTEYLNCGLMHWMDVGREGEGIAGWVDGKRHHCSNVSPQISVLQPVRTGEVMGGDFIRSLF